MGLTDSSGNVKSDQRSGALWIIDPLDGTTNYVHQFPVFCISIGLEIDGELVLGVVDTPKLGTRYHAVKGRGAYCNGEKIHCSKRDQFKDGLFATGFFGHDTALEEQLEPALTSFASLAAFAARARPRWISASSPRACSMLSGKEISRLGIPPPVSSSRARPERSPPTCRAETSSRV